MLFLSLLGYCFKGGNSTFFGEFIEEIIKKKFEKHAKKFFSKCLLRHGVLCVFVGFCTGHLVSVSFKLTYHCLQHSFL